MLVVWFEVIVRIIFIGTTNAMPMAYARMFKEQGFNVTYVVDVPLHNTLSRPECHYEDISYPYPAWIKEVTLNHHSLRTIFPKIGFRKILKEASGFDVYFLCDWYISLAPYLPESSSVIILPHGADVDVWCNFNKAGDISRSGSFSRFWYFKLLLARKIIKNMRRGLSRSNVITYYPKGLNSDGDSILEEFKSDRRAIVRRYDVNLSSFLKRDVLFRESVGALRLCSAVRFDFVPIPGVDNKYLKGNDLIIKGIGRFYREVSKNISVTFFSKGRDVDFARKLCMDEGIDDVVIWHDPVPFQELLEIMQGADICFDQVGGHWVGAVGVYSMLLGKPLIANYRPDVLDSYFLGDNPISQAATVDEVFEQLVQLSDGEARRVKSKKLYDFAISNFDSERVYNEYVSLLQVYGDQ
jgi:hypothetical protein